MGPLNEAVPEKDLLLVNHSNKAAWEFTENAIPVFTNDGWGVSYPRHNIVVVLVGYHIENLGV